jgi:hypothetical protein
MTRGEPLPLLAVFDTRIEFTWQGWSAQPIFGVMAWMEALLVVSFLRYWRVPAVQRSGSRAEGLMGELARRRSKRSSSVFAGRWLLARISSLSPLSQ